MEAGAWWIGDTERMVVCPLCEKMHMGNLLAFLNYLYANGVEMKREIEKDVELVKLFTGDKK